MVKGIMKSLSITPNVPESYYNVKEEIDLLQIDEISPDSVALSDSSNLTAEEIAFATDMKMQARRLCAICYCMVQCINVA